MFSIGLFGGRPVSLQGRTALGAMPPTGQTPVETEISEKSLLFNRGTEREALKLPFPPFYTLIMAKEMGSNRFV